jgi:lactate permease
VGPPTEPMQGAGRFTRPAIAGAATADSTHEREVLRRSDDTHDTRRDVWLAYAPYIIIVAVLSLAQWGPIKTALESVTQEIDWPGLNVVNADGEEPGPAIFKFNWAITPGTLLLVSGLLTMLVLRISPMRAIRIYGQTLNQLKWAILTIAAVLGLGFLLNYSAATYTLGLAAAATGILFPFFSPLIGWLGVALTGSDTSSNALFANLQKVTAQQLGLSPILTVGANSSGGVLGKMISPQNLAVGTSATGLQGKEGDLLRLVLKWSIGLVIVMSILVVLQAYVLRFFVPG